MDGCQSPDSGKNYLRCYWDILGYVKPKRGITAGQSLATPSEIRISMGSHQDGVSGHWDLGGSGSGFRLTGPWSLHGAYTGSQHIYGFGFRV